MEIEINVWTAQEPSERDAFGWSLVSEGPAGHHHEFGSGPRYSSEEEARSELDNARAVDGELATLPLHPIVVDRSLDR